MPRNVLAVSVLLVVVGCSEEPQARLPTPQARLRRDDVVSPVPAADNQLATMRARQRAAAEVMTSTEDDASQQRFEAKQASAKADAEAKREAAEREADRKAQCKDTYPSRLAEAKRQVAGMPAARAHASATCAGLLPRCAIVGSVSACRGVTDDDKLFFDSVCRSWPNVDYPQFAQSGDCGDVDPIKLDGGYGSEPDELAAIRAARP